MIRGISNYLQSVVAYLREEFCKKKSLASIEHGHPQYIQQLVYPDSENTNINTNASFGGKKISNLMESLAVEYCVHVLTVNQTVQIFLYTLVIFILFYYFLYAHCNGQRPQIILYSHRQCHLLQLLTAGFPASWKNHGISFWEIAGNPGSYFIHQ